MVLGWAHQFNRQPEAAIPELEESLRINPNFAQAHDWMGTALASSGRAMEAISHLEMAVRLSPSDPAIGLFYTRLVRCYLYLEQYEESVAWARKAIQKHAPWTARAFLTAALAQLGRNEEARDACKELMRVLPTVTIEFARELQDRDVMTPILAMGNPSPGF